MTEAATFEPDKKRSKTTLRILPEQSALRGKSPFLEGLDWKSESQDNTPRALRGLARIVDGGLCHRCGSCVGICPTSVLALDTEEYPRVKNASACTDCDLCVKVCPGDEFDYKKLHAEQFGVAGDLLETHGHFKEAAISYAADGSLRENSTSGGLVTALLLHLLESKQIDGAVVIAPDKTVLWKGAPIVARSREELLSTAKSKYAISPTNSVLSEIRTKPGRYAVVGLPCQIHGIVKAKKLDERLNERIALTIGLCCHAAIEHEAFRVIWDGLGEKAARAKKFISRVGKHPGTPQLELDDGSRYPVYFGERSGYRPTSIEVINILYRLYTPARCLTCFDAMAEFADISVGDPWMAPPDNDVDFYQGWSFVLLRSQVGLDLYRQAEAAGNIVSKSVTRREALTCNELMSGEKRWRAFRVIETHRRQGKSIPSYGDPHEKFPRHTGLQFVKTELHMLSHIFCFLPRYRASVLRFFLGKGYWLFWLNSRRRATRFWWRDTKARISRMLFGRR
ncbi:MAG: Coenzyme F420 hydrogenase/dehydrogenase, beta subunit C-terminal domain [Deltaproteobacteria bacterium]|nr:Coenzyme F420 hydrogenase/dehydrogenase, beta subunit C-terminal domain [Deltaproteobacteria bacterium]